MQKLLKLIYIANVIFLGFTFFGAGMAKLFFEHKFIGFMGPVWLEDELKPYNLDLYARFIAYGQVTIGYALLSFRFRSIGAVMLVPMLANILMVTISLNWKGTPYVVAVFLLQNIYILWYDRKQYLHLITGEFPSANDQKARKWQGNLIWAGSYAMVIISIPLSYTNLAVAWALAAIGLLIGSMSNQIEARRLKAFR